MSKCTLCIKAFSVLIKAAVYLEHAMGEIRPKNIRCQSEMEMGAGILWSILEIQPMCSKFPTCACVHAGIFHIYAGRNGLHLSYKTLKKGSYCMF